MWLLLSQVKKTRPDFEENVRGGGKIFTGGATLLSKLTKIPLYFYTIYIIMSACLVIRNIIK